MQTESITGRTTASAAPLTAPLSPASRRLGSEEFDRFVEKAGFKGIPGVQNNQPNDQNGSVDVKLPARHEGDEGVGIAPLDSTEGHPDDVIDQDKSWPEPAQITAADNTNDTADQRYAKANPVADLAVQTQPSVGQKAQQPAEFPVRNDVYSSAGRTTGGDEPALTNPSGIVGAQSSINGTASGNTELDDSEPGTEVQPPLTRAISETNAALTPGLWPVENPVTAKQTVGQGGVGPGVTGTQNAATADPDRFGGPGGQPMSSEPGAIRKQAPGPTETAIRLTQTGISMPASMPVAPGPKAIIDSPAPANGLVWPTGELTKPDVINFGRPSAGALDAPELNSNRPPAPTMAAPQTTGAMMPAFGGGVAMAGKLMVTPEQGSVSAAVDLPELNLASLVEPALQSASGRIAENILARQDLARPVATQMADALIKMQGGKVEISLSPVELGRVRMALSTTDAGVSVLITAERPETMDLMRRHISLLADEFRKLGYVDIGFEFSQGNENSGFDNEPAAQNPGDEIEPDRLRDLADREIAPPILPPNTRGLDLRL